MTIDLSWMRHIGNVWNITEVIHLLVPQLSPELTDGMANLRDRVCLLGSLWFNYAIELFRIEKFRLYIYRGIEIRREQTAVLRTELGFEDFFRDSFIDE